MTRQEFIDNTEYWSELIEVCSDYGCSVCDDVYDSDQCDDWIDEHTEEWAENENWRELRDMLDAIPTGYDYYRIDEYDNVHGLDNQDFENYKSQVAEWMDDHALWDAEEEEFDDNEEPVPIVQPQPVDESAPEEDFSISELMEVCQSQLQSLPIVEETVEEDVFDFFDDIPFS